MMGLSVWKLLLILVIVLVLFGAGRIPRIMGDLGKGIRSLKEGLKGDEPSPEPDQPKPVIIEHEHKD